MRERETGREREGERERILVSSPATQELEMAVNFQSNEPVNSPYFWFKLVWLGFLLLTAKKLLTNRLTDSCLTCPFWMWREQCTNMLVIYSVVFSLYFHLDNNATATALQWLKNHPRPPSLASAMLAFFLFFEENKLSCTLRTLSFPLPEILFPRSSPVQLLCHPV